jgi:hypothetical protein
VSESEGARREAERERGGAMSRNTPTVDRRPTDRSSAERSSRLSKNNRQGRSHPHKRRRI